jgi:hypothetical protein
VIDSLFWAELGVKSNHRGGNTKEKILNTVLVDYMLYRQVIRKGVNGVDLPRYDEIVTLATIKEIAIIPSRIPKRLGWTYITNPVNHYSSHRMFIRRKPIRFNTPPLCGGLNNDLKKI